MATEIKEVKSTIINLSESTWSLIIGIIALIIAIISITKYNYLDITILCIVIGLVSFYYLIRSNLYERKQKLILKNLPEPLTINENDGEHITRENLGIYIKDFLEKVSDQFDENTIIITGKSGVGKSTMMTRILEKQKKVCTGNFRNADIYLINNYSESSLFSQLLELRDGEYSFPDFISHLEKSKILVFDQFEYLFQQNPIEIERSVTLLKKILNRIIHSRQNKIKIFFVIREEWFSNLFIFKDCLRWTEIVPVYGFEENLRSEVSMRFRNITGLNDTETDEIISELSTTENKVIIINRDRTLEQNQTIRPVEIFIVLKMLKSLKKDIQNFTMNDYFNMGGIEGIMLNYFKFFIDATEDIENCERILFALSVQPSDNRKLTINEISRLTNVDQKKIEIITNFLTKQRLIKEIKMGVDTYFDWAHDFLAEKFNEISGSLLTQDDRDNINFFWFRLRRGKKNDEYYEDEVVSAKFKNLSFGWYLLSIITLFLAWIKVIHVNWPYPISIVNYVDLVDKGVNLIDVPFTFILISLGSWSTYVFFINYRILSKIKEKLIISRIITWFLEPISFVCIVLTILSPELWLTYTGVGGLFVGIKYLLLSKINFFKAPILKSHKRFKGWYAVAGSITIVNCLVLIFGGIFLYVPIFNLDSVFVFPQKNIVITLSLFIWIVMIYFSIIISIFQHTSKKEIPTRISEYFRNQYRSEYYLINK